MRFFKPMLCTEHDFKKRQKPILALGKDKLFFATMTYATGIFQYGITELFTTSAGKE